MLSRVRAYLARRLRRRLGFPLEELALARLKRAGLNPKLVFDVGASYGPFAAVIGEHWPSAEVHCFEPEPEYANILTRLQAADSRVEFCQALVGAVARPEQDYFFHLGASSVLQNSDDPAAASARDVRRARMITLDDYAKERGVRPDFLKIDVQGYELEVLKGAQQILSSIEVIFTEVNHIEIYRGAPLAAEVISWLAERGYALHDICNFMPRPSDGALWQSDMIFIRDSSQLRSSKDWL